MPIQLRPRWLAAVVLFCASLGAWATGAAVEDTLAEGLTRAGIATLRYDKRGVAGSASAQVVEGELRFDDFAEDAVAWVDSLRRTGRFAHVAVIGHSEGVTLGLLAAQRAPVDAYVSVAGLSRDLLTLLDAQLRPRLATAPALLEAHTRIIDALRHGATVPDVPAPLMSIYRPGVQPYLASAGKIVAYTDPALGLTAGLVDFIADFVKGAAP